MVLGQLGILHTLTAVRPDTDGIFFPGQLYCEKLRERTHMDVYD